jgi:hypothetical protein
MVFLEAVSVIAVWEKSVVASFKGISEPFYIFYSVWAFPFLLELG